MNISNYREQSIDIQKLGLKITNFSLIDSPLSMKEIKWLVSEAIKIFRDQPTVLKLQGQIKVIGDICGHYSQLIKIFEAVGSPSNKNYLFLGNYVGKGPNSIQVLILLLYYKVKHPQTFFMLRGRFQMGQKNYIFGFYQECAKKYDSDLWLQINKLFNYFPLSATIGKKIYCMSSGLSSSIKTIHQISSVNRSYEISGTREVRQILESKLKKTYQNQNYYKNSSFFREEDVYNWINQNQFSLIIRSNEVLLNGFEFNCKHYLLTICSIPNFLKTNNMGAILSISENLLCSFHIIKGKS